MRALIFVLLVFVTACGKLDIDAKGVLEETVFELQPVAATCAKIDNHCKTSNHFERISEYEILCFVYIDNFIDRDELSCLQESVSCTAMKTCPLVENDPQMYAFVHTQESTLENVYEYLEKHNVEVPEDDCGLCRVGF